jgi:hypothetical protein
MELGLACSVCSHLNPLRAATCDRCNAAIAPRMAMTTAAGNGSGALRSAAAPVVGAQPAAVINIGAPATAGGGAKLMGTMQLPTVQPPTTPPTSSSPARPLDPVATLNHPVTGPNASAGRPQGTVGPQPIQPPQASQPSQASPRFNAVTGLPEGPGNVKPAAKTMFFAPSSSKPSSRAWSSSRARAATASPTTSAPPTTPSVAAPATSASARTCSSTPSTPASPSRAAACS